MAWKNPPGVAPGRQDMRHMAPELLIVYISTLEIPNGLDLVGQAVSIIGDLSCQSGGSLFLEISKADGPSLPPDPLGMYRCGFPGHREPREEWATKGSATTSVCLSTLPLGTNHLCVSIPSPAKFEEILYTS